MVKYQEELLVARLFVANAAGGIRDRTRYTAHHAQPPDDRVRDERSRHMALSPGRTIRYGPATGFVGPRNLLRGERQSFRQAGRAFARRPRRTLRAHIGGRFS